MINLGFWSHFAIASRDTNKPILCLAPMADVTDSAFRFMIAKYSKQTIPHQKVQGSPLSISHQFHSQGTLEEVSQELSQFNNYVTWTEFVSADGLVLAHEAGRQKLLKDLEYSEIERPIVAQLFGSRPENMHKAAKLVASLGFDGLDINMGCPDKSIEKQGAGAAMIKNPKLAREIIRAAKAGVLEYANEADKEPIPVSVKTRLGYNKDELEEPARTDGSLGGWLPELLAEEPAVITIHARTRKEMSKVPARWERIKRAVEIRDSFYKEKAVSEDTGIFLLENSLKCSPQSGSQVPRQQPFPLIVESGRPSPLQGEGVGGEVVKTLIFGNGDVESIADAYQKAEATGCDGVMLGRAIFGNPFLFANKIPTPKEKLTALVEHIKLFDHNLGTTKSFAVMKKHFKSYLLPLQKDQVDAKSGAELKNLKDGLLGSSAAGEAIELIERFIHNNLK